MMTVGARLNAFRKQHRLTRQKLADAFATPVKTLDSWLYSGVTPPGVMVPMVDMIEKRPEVRSWLGLVHRRKRRRGKPFEPGHPWRFNDERRKQLLAEKHSRVA